MKPTIPLTLALLATAGCSAQIEVTTDPISQDIPFQSVGLPAYSEIAVDIPEEAQGLPESLTIDDLEISGNVLNQTSGTSLDMALKLSFEGTAVPGTLLQHPVKPLYYDSAETLIAEASYPQNSTTPFLIEKGPLLQILGKKRIWILINNTVTSLGLGDTPKLRLQNVVIHAVVTKDFRGLGPGTEALGL